MNNNLFEIFDNHTGNEIYKWEHYFDIYEKHFLKFKNSPTPITVLEIGVLNGGSLQMWQKYFGPNATIVGIDIYDDCKKFEKENIKIRIGSQADKIFLKELTKEFPQIDVLIDDGSHRVLHQIITFEYLFKFIKLGGVYLVEDTHTSYWVEYGGGNKRRGSFLEFSKNLVDSLYARYSEQKGLKVDYYTENLYSIHFYDSIVCFDKQKTKIPITLKRGVKEPDRISKYSELKKTIFFKFFYSILIILNKILQLFNLRGFILNGSKKK
jgi:hypothetical protein